MRMTYDLGMGLVILTVGAVMLWGGSKDIPALYKISQIDPLIRYLFGGLCILYGAFRVYRGIKRDY
jgi:cytochrome c biogenesis protein CcdA